MLAVLAEFERDQTIERTKMALRHKKMKGERTGNIPYGYRLSTDNIHIEKDEQEQAVITLARQYKAQGLTLRAIATKLTEQGYVSRTGKPFLAGSIQVILKQEPPSLP